MVEWGMTPLKAMQAGTANGAALLGLEDVGVVEAGARRPTSCCTTGTRSRTSSTC